MLIVVLLQPLAEISGAIFDADDRASLFAAITSGCATLGFDRFVLSCHKADAFQLTLDATMTNLSPDFLRDYDHFHWADVDAIAARVLSGEQAFAWDSSTPRSTDASKKSFIDFLHSCGVSSGVTIPILHEGGTVSMLSLISSADRAFDERTVLFLKILANTTVAKAEMLGLCPAVSKDQAISAHALTEIQVEILKWIAEGKSNLDISTIASLNERSVRYHVSEILKKLGVATRMQAAAIYKANAHLFLRANKMNCA